MPRRPAGVPAYKADIYSDGAIVDPHPHYQRLRDLGSVVWLVKHKAYALPRYSQCKAVLRDDATFLSGTGVALNRITNRLSRGTTLNSDGVAVMSACRSSAFPHKGQRKQTGSALSAS
jgi:cytochrome P450